MDATDQLQSQVKQAQASNTALEIRGGGSKSFLGVIKKATLLDISQHTGVINYQPTELVVTARAGTKISDIKTALAAAGQTLPFEPPTFNDTATIGGTVAAALAGPGRAFNGGVRDYILGCKVLNGQGQVLQFGGEVMKNVAGYDVTRLMTGAMGTLGVLLEVSLKVLPSHEYEITLAESTDIHNAINAMQALGGSGLPITAAAFIDNTMYTRLAGSQRAVDAAATNLSGNKADTPALWEQLREQSHEFFTNSEQPLWRISVPALTPVLDINGQWLYDWAGKQRWLSSDEDAPTIRAKAQAVGGHATLYKANLDQQIQNGVFHPLPPEMLSIHTRLKQQFDPAGIFNPQRLYPDF